MPKQQQQMSVGVIQARNALNGEISCACAWPKIAMMT
jgi:hypothetical protein